RVSAYMSKYLTKELLSEVPSKKKRISTSRGIRLFEKRQKLGWNRDPRSIERFYARYSRIKAKPVADVIVDEIGLKSFSTINVPIDVFHCLLRFFENPYAALRVRET